jgi:hypothetical protein
MRVRAAVEATHQTKNQLLMSILHLNFKFLILNDKFNYLMALKGFKAGRQDG